MLSCTGCWLYYPQDRALQPQCSPGGLLLLNVSMTLLRGAAGDAEDGIVSLAVQYLYERVGGGATGATHDLKCGSATSKSIPEQSMPSDR